MRIGRISGFTTEHFALAKSQQMRFIELCCNNAEDAARVIDSEASIRDSIRTYGIDVSCVGRWNHELTSGGALCRERLAQYEALMETAITLGAKTFVTGVNYDESISLYRNYTLAIDALGTLIEKSAGRIRVAVQNCHWNNFIDSPRQWDILFSELPELYIKYDPSHAYKRGADYLAEMSDYGHKIAHMHIKGILKAGSTAVDDPPAGMDAIAWPSVFAILYARGYRGDLSIEPHSKTWQGSLGDFGVRFTRDYIRPFVYDGE